MDTRSMSLDGRARLHFTRHPPPAIDELKKNDGPSMNRILIATSDPQTRRLLSCALTSGSCETLQAGDGEEAWQVMERYHPDVAVLDVIAPGRSGLQLAVDIKNNAEMHSTRVVLLTSLSPLALSDSLQPEATAGCPKPVDLCVVKPFSPAILIEAIRSELASRAG